MDDDVLEIGEDGAFNIPSPPSKPSQQFFADTFPNDQQSADHADPPSQSKSNPIENEPQIPFSEISFGEYKIFRNSENEMVVIARVGKDTTPTTFHANDKTLVIVSNSGGALKIDLPVEVDPAHVNSKHHNELVIIKLKLRR